MTAILESKVLALVDGKRVGPEHQGIEFPVFSPDGSRHAYVAGGDSGSVVVVDGEEGPPFDRVVTPRFAPDGARLVYRARRSGGRFAVQAFLAPHGLADVCLFL